MFTDERRQHILSRLLAKGKASSAELAVELKVSEDTIRRDLKDLSENGLIKKVHGGAMAMSSVPFEHSDRASLNVDGKRKMAAQAARLIKSGMLVFVDGGTTTGLIAEFLPSGLEVTFVTHSAVNAIGFSNCRSCKTILLGGTIVPELLINEGADVINAVERFNADLAVISVQGINKEKGATVAHYQDALVKRAFQRRSSELAVLAGQEKIGFTLPYMVCAFNDLDYLITDAKPDDLKELQRADLQTICV